MPAERIAEVVFPKVFPKCASCEFAQRAAEVGLERFHQATLITIECELSGGGGATQVEPGKFVEFQSRYLTVTPDIVDRDKRYERLEGNVPTCPVDISDSSQEYPDHPYLEQVGENIFNRGSRYKVPTVSPK